MKRLINLIILIAISCFIGTASAATNLNIVYVANSGQAAPNDNSNLFASFKAPHLNQGYITFLGTDTIGNQGIYTNLNGNLSVVASNATTVPGGHGSFSGFSSLGNFFNTPGNENLSIAGDTIAFLGSDHFWNNGVYSYNTSEGLTLVANQTTPIPNGQGDFQGFAYPTVMMNGDIAFWGAGNQQQEGIYFADSQGILHKLIDTNTKIPDGKGTFTHFSYLAFSRTSKNPESFAFIGNGTNKQTGIYIMKNGKVIKIADESTQIPGDNVGFFSKFSDISYDAADNEIAFIGTGILGQKGIFVYNGKSIVPLAQQTNVIPDGIGRFTNFHRPNIESKYILFEGTGNFDQEGIYVFDLDGNMFKILSNKDKINTKQIKSVTISNTALNGNQAAVLVQFTDGSSGIYLITIHSLTEQ